MYIWDSFNRHYSRFCEKSTIVLLYKGAYPKLGVFIKNTPVNQGQGGIIIKMLKSIHVLLMVRKAEFGLPSFSI